MTKTIEYRVRTLERFLVTRFEREDDGPKQGAGSSQVGIYENGQTAYEVAYALARAEAERQGWSPFDERIIYPQHPNSAGRPEGSEPYAFAADLAPEAQPPLT